MQSKSSVALAAMVALAAASANAAGNRTAGVSLPAAAPVVPSVSAMNVPTLPSASIMHTKIMEIDGRIVTPSIPTVGAQQSPLAALQADPRMQVIMAQDAQSQAAQPGALTAVYDNGSSKPKAESTVVAGSNGSGLTPLAPAGPRTPSSRVLSSIAYASYNASNGGMVWEAVKRFGRAIGAIFSRASKKANTPELSAEAYMAKLDSEGKQLQGLIKDAATTVSQLRQQVKAEAVQVAELRVKRDAALKAKRDDIADRYDSQLEPIEATHETNKAQLASAEQSLATAKQTMSEFIQRRESEYARIQASIGGVKAAQAKAKLDAIKNSMRTGQIAEKDEFDRAVRDAIAEAEGSSAAVTDEGAKDVEDFEREMEKKRRQERLEQRKKELGLEGGSEDKK